MNLRAVTLPVLAMLAAACAPVVNQRGYLPDPVGEASLKIGADSKTSVQQRLGDPSIQAAMGGDAWYYISSTEKTIAFFDPRVESRFILAVEFDKDGHVADVHHYTLKDGHIVAFEKRETPAKGKELTFLQQLFNATPGVPLGAGGGANNPGGGPPH